MIARALRVRQRLRQEDVARRVRVSRSTIARIERGDAAPVALGTVIAVFDALGASLDIQPRWHGAGLDRMLDEGHARLAGRVSGSSARSGGAQSWR